MYCGSKLSVVRVIIKPSSSNNSTNSAFPCLSLSPHLSSLLTSFPVRHLVWSSSMTIPQHFSNSTSRSVAGAAIFLGGLVLLLSQQFTGSLALAMHSALLSDVHSLCLVACVPWTTPPLALQTLPVSSGFVRPCKAHGRIGPSDVGSLAKPFPAWTATCASGLQPWLPICMACVSMSLLTTSSLPGRIRFILSISLPPRCVFGGLLVGVMTSPPHPSCHRLGPSSCPFCNDVDGSLVHHFSSCPAHVNPRAGLIPAASHRPTCLRLHGMVGCSTPSTSRTRRIRAHIRFVGLVCERLQPLLVMLPSFARSFCILGILLSLCAAQAVFSTSLNDCGCWFSSLSLRPDLRSAGPERIKETLVYIFVICAAEMLKFSDIVFFYVRTCRVRAWCSSDQP